MSKIIILVVSFYTFLFLTISPSASSNIKPSSPSSSLEATQSATPKTKIAAILTGSDAILIGASVIYYLRFYKQRSKSNNNPEESQET
ncbi:hypothetical protein A2164_00865 [Candidatus Curtissbacteria bacterium RBG_13_35_7]|uniref:Uncharacterized protein n=1 Tax=Candidatus Curtissbacteria bacterium RBG_13_35_7 TaxID=1797705 RepID=A0A1F5G5L4_9BACT|nr:MAG: hypothetical protein A2164_00865 [Candidatus Curtissbacteria bacterium RBG_13_35_7]